MAGPSECRSKGASNCVGSDVSARDSAPHALLGSRAQAGGVQIRKVAVMWRHQRPCSRPGQRAVVALV